MSTKAKTATVLSQADTASTALPWVRKPGRVPIMSWALQLEDSASRRLGSCCPTASDGCVASPTNCTLPHSGRHIPAKAHL